MSSRNGKLWLLKNVPLTPDYQHTFGVEAYCIPTDSGYYDDNGERKVTADVIRRWQHQWFTDVVEWSTATTGNGWLHRVYEDRMYTRLSSNTLKINAPYDEIYDCNYLIISQPDMVGRYFYAFLTSAEYVQDNVTKITYQIDVMQTYLPNIDYTFNNKVFIERETVLDDTIGLHTNSEGLDIGDYITRSVNHFRRYTRTDNKPTLKQGIGSLMVVGFASEPIPSTNEDFKQTGKTQYSQPNSMPSSFMPLYWTIIGEYGNIALDATMSKYISAFDNTEKIVAICAIPSYCFGFANEALMDEYIVDGDTNIRNCSCIDDIYPAGTPRQGGTDVYRVKLPAIPNDYLCNNNKCKTYPYVYGELSSGTSAVQLKYENFNDTNNPFVAVLGSWGFEPQLMAYPIDYEGIENNLDYTVSLRGFAQLAWVGETFANWLNQNSGALITSALASGGQIASGIVQLVASKGKSVGGVTSIISGASGIHSTLGSIHDAAQKPDTFENNYNVRDVLSGWSSSEPNSYLRSRNFRCSCKTIRNDALEAIDTYFSMYGYKVIYTGIPSLRNRENWDYIKTVDCKLTFTDENGTIYPTRISGTISAQAVQTVRSHAGLNSSVIKTICDIFNSGVTFWHNFNGNKLGNYDFEYNRPVIL